MKQFVIILLFVMFLLVGTARAQTGGNYTLTWHSIDSGGATLTGGSYTLTGNIGQPDATILFGGDYWLSGGFWPARPQFVYLPIVLK